MYLPAGGKQGEGVRLSIHVEWLWWTQVQLGTKFLLSVAAATHTLHWWCYPVRQHYSHSPTTPHLDQISKSPKTAFPWKTSNNITAFWAKFPLQTSWKASVYNLLHTHRAEKTANFSTENKCCFAEQSILIIENWCSLEWGNSDTLAPELSCTSYCAKISWFTEMLHWAKIAKSPGYIWNSYSTDKKCLWAYLGWFASSWDTWKWKIAPGGSLTSMGWNRRTRPATRPAIWPSSISSTLPPFKRPFLLPPVIWTSRTSPLLD